jgi:diguanylate cyclase (GGDEF)-like protein
MLKADLFPYPFKTNRKSNVSRRAGDRQSAPNAARRFAQALAAIRYDLSWRFARPGAFRQRFEQAIANMPQGICLYDAQDRLQLVNEQFCRIYNQPMSRLHTGMTLYDVLADSCTIGNYSGRGVDEIYQARKRFIDRREKGTFLQQLGNGRLIAIYHQPLQDGGWVCTYEDITERRKAEARIEFLAHHDGLTELPNRVLFTERLDHAISQASLGNPCALLCLDLDGFKNVNDRLGHAAGDLLLKTVAQRLRHCVRSDDTCARLGGDEFAIVLPNVSPAVALRIAHQITSVLGEAYDLGTLGSAEIGSSIGIACAPDHAASSDQLLLVADRALYISKKAKLGVPALFDHGLEDIGGAAEVPQARGRSLVDDGRSDELRLLANDLAEALRDGSLYLHYQPIYESASGRPIALEALARWNAPDRGGISPTEFVHAAEQHGLIGPLTEWVLSSACREASRWTQQLQVSVNLSPLNLRDAALVPTVERVLKQTGLSPSRLVLELTEASLIDRSEDVALRLGALRKIGVGLWLDDFGSGYANFEYLQHLACDVVKIDRSFLARSEKRRELLGAIISLAQACGLRVAVEGVETAEHRELLAELGCDLLQGFLLARPQPPEQLRSSLALDLPFHDGASIIPATATNEPDKDRVGSRNVVAQPTQVSGSQA